MNIGLSQRLVWIKKRAYDALEHGWYSYLEHHTLYPIRNDPTQDFKKIAQTLDAFIITGGDDDIVRRTTEIKLATQMMIQGKPIIGVCHGAFMLTDLIGGTVEDVITHMDTSHSIWYFGEEKVVNSYHNLCISAPPAKSTVLAVDREGNCESWIDGKIASVVWHPERMETPWIPDEVQDLLKG